MTSAIEAATRAHSTDCSAQLATGNFGEAQSDYGYNASECRPVTLP